MRTVFAFCLLFFACFPSCRQKETVDYLPNECKRQPPFIARIGMDPMRAAYSTSEKKIPGLVLLQLNNFQDTSGKKVYQHPSWKMSGRAGPLQVDANGNCYVAPVPVINTLQNPADKQNIVYKVDGQSGIMNAFLKLPDDRALTPENPYGILGFAYLCDPEVLYVSSVQGSTRMKTEGRIYAINPGSGEVIETFNCEDPIGMGISFMGEVRKLYFGSARTSDIYSVELDAEGKFASTPKHEISLSGLGARGDDKARRIRFDKDTGDMLATGVEFNFNLTAPTEKQETVYIFRYDEELNKWTYRNSPQ